MDECTEGSPVTQNLQILVKFVSFLSLPVAFLMMLSGAWWQDLGPLGYFQAVWKVGNRAGSILLLKQSMTSRNK